CQHGYSIPFTF
nr:immunoglobulin light chain junction region [Macaca mulatta]